MGGKYAVCLLSDPLQKKFDDIYSETGSIFNKFFFKSHIEPHQNHQLFALLCFLCPVSGPVFMSPFVVLVCAFQYKSSSPCF